MNTTEKGNLTELKVAVRLLEKGYKVLRPFGDGCRYDLAIDLNGKFSRVQCKTGRLNRGTIIFNTVSKCTWIKENRHYHGQIEFFGVHCPQTDKIYLVPVDKTRPGKCRLRVEPTKNSQSKGITFAKNFEI